MRAALTITALLLTTPASAACHHYARWMYPWRQPSCSIRHPQRAAPTPAPAATPPVAQERPPAASEPSADAFTAHWATAAADAMARNLTPACGKDHCALAWEDAAGSITMLFSYVDGMRIYCVDNSGPTINCLKSDGTEQSVEVKSLSDEVPSH